MSNEEMVALVQKNWDQKIVKDLCLNNEGLVRSIAYRFRNLAEMDDMIQEGFIALFMAIKNYDVNKGFSFTTYASECIVCGIKNYISEFGNAIRIPRNMKLLILNYRRFISMYDAKHNTEPKDEEIKDHLHIGQRLLNDIKKADYIMQVSSLDVDVDESGSDLGSLIPAPNNNIEECLNSIANDELKAVLWALVDATGEYEGKVIRCLYMGEKTVSKTAECLNKSESEVNRLKNKSLRSLKMKKDILKPYISDELRYSLGIKGGYKWYMNTGSSSTEYIAMKLLEEDTKHNLKKAYI